jgi:hypothetical protein
MSMWHNKLGEDGQRLTILSLLPRAGLDRAQPEVGGKFSLHQAVEEIFRIGGEDGRARAVLSVTVQNHGEPEFTSEENVALRDLADRLYGAFGPDGQIPTVLRLLGPDDELLAAPDGGDPGENGGRLGEGALGALRRFREAVHRLFGGSAEQGVPPTVLSLLVGPNDTGDKPEPTDAP